MPLSLLKARAVLVAAIAGGAAAVSLSEGGTATDVNELAVELGKASGAVVKPEDIRWERSGGVVGDLVLGRFALFLGSATANGPRDVYRARVRLSPEGRPLSVGMATAFGAPCTRGRLRRVEGAREGGFAKGRPTFGAAEGGRLRRKGRRLQRREGSRPH